MRPGLRRSRSIGGFDLAVGDEQAKAAQEIAKATGKGIDVVKGAGKFFNRIFGQGIEAKVGVWADNAIATRQMNAIDLAVKVQAKLDEAGITEIRALPMKVGFPLLEAASLEDDPMLQDMFVNLLASALNSSEDEIRKKYVTVLSEMSGSEALLLKFLFDHKYTEDAYPDHQKVSFGIKQYRAFTFFDLKRYAGAKEDDIRSLKRLGILKSVKVEMRLDFGADVNVRKRTTKFGIYPDIEQTAFTEFGIDLTTRVILGRAVGKDVKDAEREL